MSDQSQATANALAARWPANPPCLFACEHHLRKNAQAYLNLYGLTQEGNSVFEALRMAFTSPAARTAFRRRAGRFIRISTWAQSVDALVRVQATARPSLPQIHSNSAVEATLPKVRASNCPRSYALHTKERTDRLLELMWVAMNGKVSEVAFAHSTCEALLTGLVLPKQMSIVDVGAGPVSRRRDAASGPAPKPSLWR